MAGAKLLTNLLGDTAEAIATRLAKQEVPEAAAGIRAYHSSPYDFDKFDLSKIGTGEGNQAYGHGIYAAESPAVSGQGGDYWRKFRYNMPQGTEKISAYALMKENFNRDAAIARLIKSKEKYQLEPTDWLHKEDTGIAFDPAMYDEAVNRLSRGEIVGPRTYELNIKANPENFLNWDKEIAEQSGHVQNILYQLAEQDALKYGEYGGLSYYTGDPYSYSGEDVYRYLGSQFEQPGATDLLLSNKIPGIRYLDGNSRNMEEPYIKNVENGFEVYLGNDRNPVGIFPSENEAKLAAKELDTRSHNYVTFDPQIIDITKKYAAGGSVDQNADIEAAMHTARQTFDNGGGAFPLSISGGGSLAPIEDEFVNGYGGGAGGRLGLKLPLMGGTLDTGLSGSVSGYNMDTPEGRMRNIESDIGGGDISYSRDGRKYGASYSEQPNSRGDTDRTIMLNYSMPFASGGRVGYGTRGRVIGDLVEGAAKLFGNEAPAVIGNANPGLEVLRQRALEMELPRKERTQPSGFQIFETTPEAYKRTTDIVPQEDFMGRLPRPVVGKSLPMNERLLPILDIADDVAAQYASKMAPYQGKNVEYFYHTGPVYEKAFSLLGDEGAGREFMDRFSKTYAGTSPRTPTEQNLLNSSLLSYRVAQGLPLERPVLNITGNNDVGYPMISGMHPDLTRRLLAGEDTFPNNPKPSSFAENVRGNLQGVTADTHNIRGILVSYEDLRPGSIPREWFKTDVDYDQYLRGGLTPDILSGGINDSLASQTVNKISRQSEYGPMADITARSAEILGEAPAPTQSLGWFGLGDMTNLRSAPKTLTELMGERIDVTAQKLGVDPDEAARLYMQGKIPLMNQGGAVNADADIDAAMMTARAEKAGGGGILPGAITPFATPDSANRALWVQHGDQDPQMAALASSYSPEGVDELRMEGAVRDSMIGKPTMQGSVEDADRLIAGKYALPPSFDTGTSLSNLYGNLPSYVRAPLDAVPTAAMNPQLWHPMAREVAGDAPVTPYTGGDVAQLGGEVFGPPLDVAVNAYLGRPIDPYDKIDTALNIGGGQLLYEGYRMGAPLAKAAFQAVKPTLQKYGPAAAGVLGLTAGSEDAEAAGAGLYSKAMKVIRELPMNKMEGNQALAMLKKGGIGPEELQYTGLADTLPGRGTVTKDELIDFVTQNDVQLNEVIRGGGKPSHWDDVRPSATASEPYMEEWNALTSKSKELQDAATEAADAGRWNEFINSNEFVKQRNYIDTRMDELHEKMVQATIDEMGGLGLEPKFGPNVNTDWSLKGGKKYQETLITMPDASSELSAKINSAREARQQAVEEYAQATTPDAMAAAQAKIKKYTSLENEFRDLKEKNTSKPFGSGHWDEKNVLAHIRTNQFTGFENGKYFTPASDNIFNLDELQSDWAQIGRKQGFADPKLIKQAKSEYAVADRAWMDAKKKVQDYQQSFTFDAGFTPKTLNEVNEWHQKKSNLLDIDPEFQKLMKDFHKSIDVRNDAKATLKDAEGGVQIAPYVQSTSQWTDLGLKKAVSQAIDSGSDVFTWTPGKVQANRYDLSTQVSELTFLPNDDGTYHVGTFLPDGDTLSSASGMMDLSTIEKTFGKEIAKKVKNGEFTNLRGNAGTISGKDLSVGGQGMKNFYDNIIPQRLSEIIRKTTGEKPQFQTWTIQTSDGPMEVQGLRFTPEMKAKLQSIKETEGGYFPHMAYGGKVDNSSVNKALQIAAEASV